HLDAGEKVLEYETRLRCKDGSIKTVLIDSSVLRDDDGRFLHTQCFTRDITERRRDEEIRSRLAEIVAASDDAIISKTLDGIILSWNGGAERLYGFTAAEAIGQSINMIIPPELRAEETTIQETLLRGEHIQHFETVRVTSQGKRVDISLTVSPIRDGSGRIVGASKVARDVTQRRRAEQELADAARRKDEFVAMLAHELRNPLAPLSNALEMLDVVGRDPRQLKSIRAMMQRQLKHMVRLVDDLLDASRISRDKLQLRKETLELGSVLNEAIEACRGQIEGAALELEVSLPQEPIHLEADPVRLVQVICNILGNAAKYTERGGKVWLHVNREGDTAAITIRDTGIGIPPEMLSDVFEMFTQVDRSLERMRGGLGIGLSLAKRFVELHGGTLTAHSDGMGRGSEFVARFPVLPSTPRARQAEKAAAPNSISNHRSRVLVVDDNRDAATSLALLLKLSGSEVEVAYDGLEAVEKAAEYLPRVVLLDIGLPKLNGYDACREIRARLSGRELFIVALTGWGQDTDRQRSKDAGFDAHMVKPVDYVALTALLDSLQGERVDVARSADA
ncbi:MAG: PAS domain S-box protein, partial [Candidatus Binatia bacterium]